jgi:hypothetical protein
MFHEVTIYILIPYVISVTVFIYISFKSDSPILSTGRAICSFIFTSIVSVSAFYVVNRIYNVDNLFFGREIQTSKLICSTSNDRLKSSIFITNNSNSDQVIRGFSVRLGSRGKTKTREINFSTLQFVVTNTDSSNSNNDLQYFILRKNSSSWIHGHAVWHQKSNDELSYCEIESVKRAVSCPSGYREPLNHVCATPYWTDVRE